MVENEAELRNTWKLHHDMDLPTQVRVPLTPVLLKALLLQHA